MLEGGGLGGFSEVLKDELLSGGTADGEGEGFGKEHPAG
jgi:hypothetical protein